MMENDTFLFNINDYYNGTVVVKAPNADIAYDTLETLLRQFRQDPKPVLIDRELELSDAWSSEAIPEEEEPVDFDFYAWVGNPEFERSLGNSSVEYRRYIEEKEDNGFLVFCNDVY